jgi:hypothetical protein
VSVQGLQYVSFVCILFLFVARARAHSSTVTWGGLSSFPPLCWGVKLGWRACSRQYRTIGRKTPIPSAVQIPSKLPRYALYCPQ